MLIIPANIPPHKQLPEGSPDGAQRMELCRANFAGIERAEISDIELKREGRSYTFQTIEELRADFPEAEISVDSACCAGVTPETHEAALVTMRCCQINVK